MPQQCWSPFSGCQRQAKQIAKDDDDSWEDSSDYESAESTRDYESDNE
eukprot:CAMPEP_0198224294 /NCGR_PEP_ID=MMETSP1445-20131203/96290_1 /TAXON_ID=36898 /ORGANISM="Pyramimonas sp., Strain CCMP2087" /LENGTH=47 /DNA_ID= /DNA_START= /DNA_END= /DNA_ORIENTATION=